MKNLLIKAAAVILALSSLAGCSKDDNHDDFSNIPEEVKADFKNRFPSATKVEWEFIANTLKADFVMENTDYEAFWKNSTSWNWIRTEKDVNITKTPLPSAVQNYLNTEFAGWKIEDVDYIWVPEDEFFEISLDMSGKPDTVILIRKDGTVVI